MPLAQDVISHLGTARAGSNPGLALTKLAPPLQGAHWAEHVASVAATTEKQVPSGYSDFFRRFQARTAAGPAYRRVLLATATSPTICGMGERTPGENGLTLHPVFGVPYIPGTSLKGILRAWVLSQGWGAPWEAGGDHFRALFGEGGDQGAAAGVDILDALPRLETGMLVVDVLTPHFADYYQGRDAPLGWKGPNPVRFLAASASVRYRIVLEGDPDWVGKASEWLGLALKERGVGAKSRAGYGRFACESVAPDSDDERDAATRNVVARRSKTDNAAAALERLGKDAVRGEVEKWLRGEPVSESFRHVLPTAASGVDAHVLLAAVALVGARWGFRADWVGRSTNPKADSNKRARAEELVAAWDTRFPRFGGEPQAALSSGTTAGGETEAVVRRFGVASWNAPKKGAKPNKVADDAAGRAGKPNALSKEAVDDCLQWLRANEGRPGQLNQVRRAYGLDPEDHS